MDPDETVPRGAVLAGYALFTTDTSKIKQKTSSLSASDHFCRLQMDSANSLFPNQAQCRSQTILHPDGILETFFFGKKNPF